jgi:hypothetical protein
MKACLIQSTRNSAPRTRRQSGASDQKLSGKENKNISQAYMGQLLTSFLVQIFI